VASYESIPFIEPSTYTKLSSNTYLGKNCNFNGLIIKGQGKVIIGNNFHSGKEILIQTSYHDYNGEALPYGKKSVHKDVIIEDNVWIGTRTIILGGSIIKEGAIIQAGSVVVGEIPKYAIAGGHPAKPYKYRDIEHYERLKKEGKFF